ncbi:MAG: S8 family serine peptidase, partial [Acidimicrobiia bacterium]|nr:S8 family serine peptidase [Acidimicrobiia bacterium]
ILVVVAAGNLNGAATACGFAVPGSVTFPGTAREALTVGAAADPQSGGWNVASFSGRGPTIDGRIKPDVVAPGINVTSAKVGGGYTSKSGTSMATPVVSGLALLLHDAQPASTADQLRSTIIGSAVNWQNLTVPNNTYGTGHVDANAALALITAEPPTVTPTLVFSYGKVDDIVLIGDWDGNQSDTPAVRRGNTYYLNNSNAGGNADRVIGYGRASDEVFVGDWDGDGIDTFAVRRGNRFFVRNSTTSGPADIVFGYGRAGDEVLVGDWDVDGVDTFAVRRGNVIHVRNDFVSGPAQNTFGYGKASDQLLVGDWDGDGVDTFGVRRGRAFHLRNSNTSGPADFAATLGNVSDTPVVGDFDADGIDEFGVRSGKVISIVL